ncbi:hypothetical protein BD769DRAFT_1391701 [Suillus cothurnatus]|nr:hypothetical protein BD769DRAFT_1391701 [Suillus cothurnatus]
MAIVINARKYGMMTEMFPSKDLLNKLLPSSPTPFDSTDRYKTPLTQELAFLDELYHGFPEWVHIIMESSYFADLVLKSIMDTHLSEIKKLQNIAGIIFKLPSKYFPDISYDHALYKQELNICLEKLDISTCKGGHDHSIFIDGTFEFGIVKSIIGKVPEFDIVSLVKFASCIGRRKYYGLQRNVQVRVFLLLSVFLNLHLPLGLGCVVLRLPYVSENYDGLRLSKILVGICLDLDHSIVIAY